MKIATWNVTGIKARHDTLLTWLREAEPDVACLQEIKSVDENFPATDIEALGYNVVTHGQKGFNGVAVLSRHPLDETRSGLPGGDDDVQARYLEVVISIAGGAVRIASLYLPNGNPVDTDKYPYKLDWMARLEAHAAALLQYEEPLVLAGDYNVIQQAIDARRPEVWVDDALYKPQTRSAFQRLSHLGLTDAVRACYRGEHDYTFWDYQAGAWQKNNGIRIDHLMLSPQAADRLSASGIDRHTRGWEKPSDHVPVWVDLDLAVG